MSSDSSQPWLHQHGRQVQLFGTVRQFPLGLSYEVRLDSCRRRHIRVPAVPESQTSAISITAMHSWKPRNRCRSH